MSFIFFAFQNSTTQKEVETEVEEEKSLAVQILENIGGFSAGFAEGILEQAQDLLDVILHPVDTASSMIDLVKMLKDNPEAVVQAMLEELGGDAKKLISGDMREVGQVVGKYVSPAMALKIVTKAKAIAKIAKKADSKDSPTPSCCCFAKGTPVSTPEGFKAIDQLNVGDLVQSKSELTGELQSKPVSELFLTKGKQLYALTTENAAGLKETVEVTDNHPYWVEGEWVESAQLKAGMILTDEAGEKVEVLALKALGKTEDTYNIEVADFHTYFVGESRVLVHNECSCTKILGHRSEHILNRHRYGAGKPGKTEFPEGWDDSKILENVVDIALDPNSTTGMGKWDSPYVIGTRDGIEIRVDFYPDNHSKYAGKISTAYPINVTPNPM